MKSLPKQPPYTFVISIYFCTWGGDYCTTDMYASDEMFDKVFNSEQVFTLDELPD